MRIAIVYTSVTGNTAEVADEIYRICRKRNQDVSLFTIGQFQSVSLNQYDVIIIGTYTWGSGEIPAEMWKLYRQFEETDCKDLTTAVFGTGDSFYPHFCGAVDAFRDMLYVHTNLAATLKIELTPQAQDRLRCVKFVDSVMKHTSKMLPLMQV